MYELATDDWLFRPKAVDNIPRDVDHLALITKCTGQDHDDATLKQYETKEKHKDLKGIETSPFYFQRDRTHPLRLQTCWVRRATERAAQLVHIESELTESTVFNDGAEEVADFVRIMRLLLTLDPAERPRAAEVLLDPAFEKIKGSPLFLAKGPLLEMSFGIPIPSNSLL
jgi:hypothetical protein